ncbi:nucleotidyltransferase domain-containing protein [Caminibacter sp.]
MIEDLKKELSKEGFIIDGIVGSFARGEEYNDIDIVYHVEKKFIDKYKGFFAVKRIEEIKKILEQKLNTKVDLIAKNSMSKTAKKYMLKDFMDV